MARHTKEFYGAGGETWGHLEKIISRGHNNSQVFEDWLDLTLCAFQNPHKEKEYLAIMGKYNNEFPVGNRPADYFSMALGQLMMEMKEKQCDVLGNIFEQKVSYGNNGQFLTPEAVCKMMVHLNNPAGQERICDPACGSGRLLIAASQLNPHAHFFGKDIDSICCKMTALNLLFFNVNGIVEHGDSLRDTLYGVWMTQRTVSGGIIRQLDEMELEEYKNQREEQLKKQIQTVLQKKQASPQPPSESVPIEGEVLEESAVPPEETPNDKEPEQPELSEGQLAEIRQAQEFGIDPMRFEEQQRLAEEAQTEYDDLPLFAGLNE